MRKVLTVCAALLLVLTLALPAAASGGYVTDEAGLLTSQEQTQLNDYAARITETYGVAAYILTVEDFLDLGYGADSFDALWQYYHDHGLGYGPDREGMILMLSMDQRDFAIFFYGDDTEYAFGEAAQIRLQDAFLDNFREDDWYGGFSDYLKTADSYLEKAENGTPVRENPWRHTGKFVLGALAVSAVVTVIFWLQMSNVALKKDASGYQTGEGLVLTRREDRFLTQTVVRRKIETSSGSGSGSSSRSGGGGSGRSGKF